MRTTMKNKIDIGTTGRNGTHIIKPRIIVHLFNKKGEKVFSINSNIKSRVLLNLDVEMKDRIDVLDYGTCTIWYSKKEDAFNSFDFKDYTTLERTLNDDTSQELLMYLYDGGMIDTKWIWRTKKGKAEGAYNPRPNRPMTPERLAELKKRMVHMKLKLKEKETK
jgi:hypothetical protein